MAEKELQKPGTPSDLAKREGASSAHGNLRKMYRTERAEGFLPDFSMIIGERVIKYKKIMWLVEGEWKGLRYGTNPHQSAAIFSPTGSVVDNSRWLKWGKGGPSLTNIQDGLRGLRIVSYFSEPSVAVMKHLNPSGVAIGTAVTNTDGTLTETYVRAREANARAAFGCTVVFNSPVGAQLAEEILKTFVEVVYAPAYDAAALQLFEAKNDLRVASLPLLRMDSAPSLPNFFSLVDGDPAIAFEDSYRTKIDSLNAVKELVVPTKRAPTEREYADLLCAWRVVVEIKSNGVVFWKDGTSFGIGAGQVDRIGALDDSIDKAHRNKMNLTGSVVASDGFLPKVDNVEAIAKEGVTAIIQPGGSLEDQNVIEACDKYGIAMVFTGERAFRH
jgi:phosphoribosylaminoimidazolecarboxamide formyltransferase/IMP cyclohydrolase